MKFNLAPWGNKNPPSYLVCVVFSCFLTSALYCIVAHVTYFLMFRGAWKKEKIFSITYSTYVPSSCIFLF